LVSNSIPPTSDQTQGRLLTLAGVFLGLYSLALSLSPAARLRTWEVDYAWQHWGAFIVWAGLFTLVHRLSKRTLPGRDPFLIPIAALLSGWGILTIWRLFPEFGLRQTLWLGVSAAALILGMHLPNHLGFLQRYKYLWLTGGLALTSLTLLFGTNPATASGPRLWLGCCGIYFQPSEPLKLLLIVYLAAYLADRQSFLSLVSAGPERAEEPGAPRTRLLPLLAPTLVMTSLALGLLLVQRDLGTASIFTFLFAVIVYLATERVIILLVSALLLALSGTAGYFLFDVVRLRIDAWLNPWLDPSGGSYQIVQSLLSVASGGLLGRGPGLGSPTLVPIPHSDFIFTAISEETGLIGAAGLLLLLALLGARGLRTALRAPDNFRRYLAAGLSAYLIGQSVLIIGGNLRLMPLTGVTLPFVSYGGSSLLTAFLSLLILLHISHSAETRPSRAPEVRPYLFLGGFLIAGLAAVALLGGWWAYYRAPTLVTRTDNLRRIIADRYVKRGSILARDNSPIAATTGTAGEYTREYLYPELGPVTGYTHPNFGQAGLEESLDPYLRGLQGNLEQTVWWNNLLYGQPPPGLDVRLSIDLRLQRTADSLLQGRPGALVLLNAQSGEILAISSSPGFDANQLEENWTDLMVDPQTSLLNRATLGRYPPGTALGPLLWVRSTAEGDFPPLPGEPGYHLGGLPLECAQEPLERTWEQFIAAGCPAAQAALGRSLGEEEVLAIYQQLGLFTTPELFVPADDLPPAGALPGAFQDAESAYLGQDELRVSPLQMALAAATLSASGSRPAPQIALAINSPSAGWTVLPSTGSPVQVFPPQTVNSMIDDLVAERLPIWQSVGSAVNGPGSQVSWYLAGTLPSWSGAPLTLVVLLEDGAASLAEVIGQAVMTAALQPR
jgi:cell division protein FtsW (lipid II flippase)